VVLDPIETLLATYGNTPTMRGELLRLFDWLNERGLTSVIIGERGRQGELTRFGVEEYVSDCVILLDQRVENQLSTRRLRLVKYRGSAHGTNEFPFTISSSGFVVLPITAAKLVYIASKEKISTGLPQLDQMLGGGLFRHSSVLISGHTGTGKTSLIASILCDAARRGERALLVSSEESPEQLVRDMSSVAIDLQHWINMDLLKIWSERTSSQGMEERLVRLEKIIEEFQPSIVGIDTLGSLGQIDQDPIVNATVVRTIDLLRSRGITAMLTVLTHAGAQDVVGVSAIIDTWLLLKNVEADGERNRLIYIVKSRGSKHSNQVREFRLTSHGPELVDVVISSDGVLTGSARLAFQDKRDRSDLHELSEIKRKHRLSKRNRREVEAKIELLSSQLEDDTIELELIAAELEEARITQARQDLLRAQKRSE
jgi:circadian clock protein KaiC